MPIQCIVVVHNHKWGNYQKEFEYVEDAEKYIDSISSDLNTYAFLYVLRSINLERQVIIKKKKWSTLKSPFSLIIQKYRRRDFKKLKKKKNQN